MLFILSGNILIHFNSLLYFNIFNCFWSTKFYLFFCFEIPLIEELVRPAKLRHENLKSEKCYLLVINEFF